MEISPTRRRIVPDTEETKAAQAAPFQVNRIYSAIITRTDIRRNMLRVDDLVVVRNQDGVYDLARIKSFEYSRDTGFKEPECVIIYLTGAYKGTTEALGKNAVSRTPFEKMDITDSVGAELINGRDAKRAFVDGKFSQVEGRFVVFYMDGAYMLGEIKSFHGKWREGRSVSENLVVKVLAASNSSKIPTGKSVDVPISAVEEDPSYTLLK
jgi:hypothetical protein